MKELSFYFFQCVNERIHASANEIEMYVVENTKENRLELIIRDNGEKFDVGFMKEDNNDFIKAFPAFQFFQKDTTKFGGDMKMLSHNLSGNTIEISYPLRNKKRSLLGDVSSFLAMMFVTHPTIHFSYSQITEKGEFLFDTKQFRKAMGKIDYTDRNFLVNLKSLLESECVANKHYA